jgi:hypothetical protein
MKATTAAFALLFATAIAVTAAAAVDPEIVKMPGYVDLERIPVPENAEELTLVDLTPSLVQFAANTSDEDPELARALAMVRSLRVKRFSLDAEHSAQLRPIVEEIESELKRDGWDQLIYVRSGEELFTVSTKKDKDKVAGLLVVAFEPDEEAAFVNVVGEINLSTLLAMARSFGDGDFEDSLEALRDD